VKLAELRLYFTHSSDPRKLCFLRVKATDIYAWKVTSVDRNNDTELHLCLARAPDYSEFPSTSKQPRLAQLRGARDQSPFSKVSNSAPLLVLRAGRSPKDLLSEMMAAWARSSKFLSSRKDKADGVSWPRSNPDAIPPHWIEELVSTLIRPCPLRDTMKDPAVRARVERELGVLQKSPVRTSSTFRPRARAERPSSGGVLSAGKTCIYATLAGIACAKRPMRFTTSAYAASSGTRRTRGCFICGSIKP
jgi:hypothetical protein